MSAKNTFNAFSEGKGWKDKVVEADSIWLQINSALAEKNVVLPQTPRRPDVRLIINNITGNDIQFKNPGDHSGAKEELIPGSGDKTAVMVMVKGETLAEQYKNAKTLFDQFDLGKQGFSGAFLAALKRGELADLVDEAYGPAPFESQAEKLVDVTWTGTDGKAIKIKPEKGAATAFGVREATMETVFLAEFEVYVKGTGTTPELVEGAGINIAVNKDWATGAETTRPIAPSVAETYYGEHFSKIPTAIVHPDGIVKSIDLKNGTTIEVYGSGKKKSKAKALKP
jgi:hypothetical protein